MRKLTGVGASWKAALPVSLHMPVLLFLILFFQRGLLALGGRLHVADDLHHVGGVEVVLAGQGVVLILDENSNRRQGP